MMALTRLVRESGTTKVANLVTLARLLAVAPITALLLAGRDEAALVLYVAAASTDLVDGWLARRSGRASEFGAQLDAVVDNVFSLAILPFLLIAFPDLWAHHAAALIVLFAGPLAYLAISRAWTGRMMMFHFLSAKLGGFLLFALWPLLALTHMAGVVTLTAAIVGLSRLEQLVFIARGGTDLDAPHALVPVGSRNPGG